MESFFAYNVLCIIFSQIQDQPQQFSSIYLEMTITWNNINKNFVDTLLSRKNQFHKSQFARGYSDLFQQHTTVETFFIPEANEAFGHNIWEKENSEAVDFHGITMPTG